MTSGDWRAWYDALDKPGWTPAPGTIGTIWTILYPIILVVCVALVVQAARGRVSWWVVLPFGLNLAANLAFTPLQFGARSLVLASVDIVVVLVTIVWGMVVAWPVARWATIAYVPYLAWVATATVLQLEITRRNL